MAQPDASKHRNHLLSSMSASDFRMIDGHLEPLDFRLRQSFEEGNKPIKFVYFPEAGFASVVATSSRNRQIEVGIIGSEGVTGISVIMGDDRSPHDTYIQLAGHGHRMAADDLREAMRKSRSLQPFLLHFAQAFMLQTAHTALANGQAKVEERLARWLLMAHDRVLGSELPLTHDFLALMLSVRRAGVSVALQQLELMGLITSKRAHIVAVDRGGLRAFANGLYGIPEGEYRRLTGWKAKP